jgi:hypothetical protein
MSFRDLVYSNRLSAKIFNRHNASEVPDAWKPPRRLLTIRRRSTHRETIDLIPHYLGTLALL